MITASILHTVKNFCNVDAPEEFFDSQLLVFINSHFAILFENGVGPKDGFVVEDYDATWDAFSSDAMIRSMTKDYICTRAKLRFDPPQSTAVQEEMRRSAEELLWRLREKAEGRFD